MSQNSQGKKSWSLSGGASMKVVSHGKEDPMDSSMMIQLEFQLKPNSKVIKIGKQKKLYS